jgi:flagellar assembly protein FliH
MSSRRITGESGGQARPLDWRYIPLRSHDNSSGAAPRLYADPSGTHSLEQEDEAARGPSLEEQLKQARELGYREGQAAAAEAARAATDAAISQLGSAIRELAGYRGRLRRDAERDLVGLSIAITRRILRREVNLDPEALLGVVKAALEKLDAREVCRIRLHPDDVGLLGRRMESVGLGRNVELVADSSIARGGVVVETTRGALDATLEGQLQEIERGLADWMERK